MRKAKLLITSFISFEKRINLYFVAVNIAIPNIEKFNNSILSIILFLI